MFNVKFALFLIALLAVTLVSAEWQNGGTKEYVLSMQKCQGSNTWTLHGLWPQYGMNCGTSFNIRALDPIRSELERFWPSCPEFNKGNENFWKHEYTKHGSCMKNITQLEYFDLGLQLREHYHKYCANYIAPNGECRIGLDRNLNPV